MMSLVEVAGYWAAVAVAVAVVKRGVVAVLAGPIAIPRFVHESNISSLRHLFEERESKVYTTHILLRLFL